MRIRESGEGKRGVPVMLLHGAGASSAVWLGTIGRLARHFHVVAPDLPGHGRSPGSLETPEEWRDAVGHAAVEKCLGPAVLVGHSLGGAAAMLAAMSWPDKVAGLVLVASAPRFQVSPQLFETLEHRFARWPEIYAELAYSPETPSEVRRRGAGIACTASQDQTRWDFQAAAAVDLRARLGEIRCPTWILGGADDLISPPKWSETLASGIQGSKLFVLPRTGHMPMHENPDALAGAVREFSAGRG